jgi:cyclase
VSVTEECFVRIAAGGGVRTIEDARTLLRSGADIVVVNTPLYENSSLINELASEFGQQCVLAPIDVKRVSDSLCQVLTECGSKPLEGSVANWIEQVVKSAVSEIYLNSMDKDGTGQGYDLQLLDLLPEGMPKLVIFVGGVGNATHLAEGLADPRLDAVATAHLFNFVGDGLKQARLSLIANGIDLPIWDIQLLEQHLRPEIVQNLN